MGKERKMDFTTYYSLNLKLVIAIIRSTKEQMCHNYHLLSMIKFHLMKLANSVTEKFGSIYHASVVKMFHENSELEHEPFSIVVCNHPPFLHVQKPNEVIS